MHKLELPIKTERYNEIKTRWISECHKKENKPTYCENYGTKLKGKISLVHYMFWVMVKGGSLTKVTHNQRAKKFVKAFDFINKALILSGDISTDQTLKFIGEPFGMTNEEVHSVIQSYS